MSTGWPRGNNFVCLFKFLISVVALKRYTEITGSRNLSFDFFDMSVNQSFLRLIQTTTFSPCRRLATETHTMHSDW